MFWALRSLAVGLTLVLLRVVGPPRPYSERNAGRVRSVAVFTGFPERTVRRHCIDPVSTSPRLPISSGTAFRMAGLWDLR